MRKLHDFELEIIRRSANADDGMNLQNTIEWIMNTQLTKVKTDTAFILARGGREVWQMYEDGTDSLLDDIESESEYYPDKSKSYPEIPTIFVVEGEL